MPRIFEKPKRQNKTYIFTLFGETSDDAAFYPNCMTGKMLKADSEDQLDHILSESSSNELQPRAIILLLFSKQKRENNCIVSSDSRRMREKCTKVTPDVCTPVFWHLWWCAPAGKTLYKGGHVAPQSCHRCKHNTKSSTKLYRNNLSVDHTMNSSARVSQNYGRRKVIYGPHLMTLRAPHTRAPVKGKEALGLIPRWKATENDDNINEKLVSGD